jgi:hypothetical protein
MSLVRSLSSDNIDLKVQEGSCVELILALSENKRDVFWMILKAQANDNLQMRLQRFLSNSKEFSYAYRRYYQFFSTSMHTMIRACRNEYRTTFDKEIFTPEDAALNLIFLKKNLLFDNYIKINLLGGDGFTLLPLINSYQLHLVKLDHLDAITAQLEKIPCLLREACWIMLGSPFDEKESAIASSWISPVGGGHQYAEQVMSFNTALTAVMQNIDIPKYKAIISEFTLLQLANTANFKEQEIKLFEFFAQYKELFAMIYEELQKPLFQALLTVYRTVLDDRLKAIIPPPNSTVIFIATPPKPTRGRSRDEKKITIESSEKIIHGIAGREFFTKDVFDVPVPDTPPAINDDIEELERTISETSLELLKLDTMQNQLDAKLDNDIVKVYSLDYCKAGGANEIMGFDILTNSIAKEVKENNYTNVIIFNGSSRQSYLMDQRYSELIEYENPFYLDDISCFEALPKLTVEINSRLSVEVCDFDSFLLIDAFLKIESGQAFREALQKRSNSSCEGNSLRGKCMDDPTKLLLLYAQMHRIASRYPSKKIQFSFYLTKMMDVTILNTFLTNNLELIPFNLELNLLSYSDTLLECHFVITGQQKGLIDFDYLENTEILSACNNSDDDLSESEMDDNTVLRQTDILHLCQNFSSADFERNKVYTLSAKSKISTLPAVSSKPVVLSETLQISTGNFPQNFFRGRSQLSVATPPVPADEESTSPMFKSYER